MENLNQQTPRPHQLFLWIVIYLIQAAQIAVQTSRQKRRISVEAVLFLSFFFLNRHSRKKMECSQPSCEACTSLSVWTVLKKLKGLSVLWVAVLWLNLKKVTKISHVRETWNDSCGQKPQMTYAFGSGWEFQVLSVREDGYKLRFVPRTTSLIHGWNMLKDTKGSEHPLRKSQIFLWIPILWLAFVMYLVEKFLI